MSSDGTTIAAIADYIYISSDSGVTWAQQTQAGPNWVSVSFSADGTKLAAAGGDGYVYTLTCWTAAPSALPTLRVPSPQPSPSPSYLPNAPTPRPSAVPTLAPTLGHTTRGLVLALDAATYVSGATTWVDSVGGRAFTLYNGPTWSSAGGGSLAFVPASAQYAQSPPLPSLSTWTIEVWHLWSGLYTGVAPCIVTDVTDGSNINFVLGSSEGNAPIATAGWWSSGWHNTAGITLTAGTWLHIVASFDGTTGNLYVNNVLKVTASMAGTSLSGNTGVRLMRRWDSGDYWGGQISKVNIYNVALTPAEVETNWLADMTKYFTSAPTPQPTITPTGQPSRQPSAQPSRRPSGQPSMQPSMQPSAQPSAHPSRQPTTSPTTVLSETTDGNALCDYWGTLTTTNKAKLTNWCGAKSGTGIYVNGPCTGTGGAWLGVTCAVVPGGYSRVSALSLMGKFLGGSLPTSIGNLGGLTSLRLNINSIAGSIPSSVGALTRLALLDLSTNALVGSMPSSLGALTKLVTLSVNTNALTGPMPASFCSLQSSIALNAYTNPGLTCYPSCLSSYSSFVKDDALSAACPSETSDSDVLCDFYNTMPTEGKAKLTNWCGAKSGTGGYVNGPCTGTAGAWLGVTCAVVGGASRVTSLNTCGQPFTACTIVLPTGLGGSLPASIGGMDALTFLHLQQASLSGSMPSSLGSLTSLKYLNLYLSGISGSIPSSLGGVTGLTYLHLGTNSLSGTIPSSLGGLTSLTQLYLDTNSLSGGIPPSLGALTGLTYLYLSGNALTGTVPASFCSLQPSIILGVQSNPGLTCYPSCLASYSSFSKGSLSAFCDGLPTALPSPAPSPMPSPVPSAVPTPLPSFAQGVPTPAPTVLPSPVPTVVQTKDPTAFPTTRSPTNPTQPTARPSPMPTLMPTGQPSGLPSSLPSGEPSSQPSAQPSRQPIRQPTGQPTRQPSRQPSGQPSRQPTGQPSRQPSRQPTRQPTGQPTGRPTQRPSGQPSREPSAQPSGLPTAQPSSQPSSQPTMQPTRQPTGQPSRQPTGQPSRQPTGQPSRQPSRQPISRPSGQPTRQPTSEPSGQPSARPSSKPSRQPTGQPTGQPTRQPTGQPSRQPSRQPTRQPTGQPTREPSGQPTAHPSRQPFSRPTGQPSRQPTRLPTSQPSLQPTMRPTRQPTGQPSRQPSGQPTRQPTSRPTRKPTGQPTRQPTGQPTARPTHRPSGQPTREPSGQPSGKPTRQPSSRPSSQPTMQPTRQPSGQPTRQPSSQPTRQPSRRPTSQPSRQPTGQPSRQPTGQPTREPSGQPTAQPSRQPLSRPTGQPSRQPTRQPTGQPTRQPTGQPSRQPTGQPTKEPSGQPSAQPTRQPSRRPTGQPTRQPSRRPTGQPSSQPSHQPTGQPTGKPSCQPSSQPSGRPSRQPSGHPTRQPTSQPSRRPTRQPSGQPSIFPTSQPSRRPSRQPTSQPSSRPTRQPTGQPTRRPSSQPSRRPTGQPSRQPTRRPTGQPTRQPSSHPTGRPTFAAQTTIKFNVTQTLTGLSATSWRSAEASAAKAFAKAVAASINAALKTKLDASKVKIHKVTSTVGRRQLEESYKQLGQSLHQLGESLQQCREGFSESTYVSSSRGEGVARLLAEGAAVSYSVTTSTQEVGNSDAAAAFASVSSALTTAITGTSFQTALTAAAASEGSTVLASAVASTAAPQISTPELVITHSAQPSGSPTSMPSLQHCPAGYRHAPVGSGATCIICQPGTFAPYDSTECGICPPGAFSGEGFGSCNLCDIGSYAEGYGTGPECKKCKWPATSAFPGSTNCLATSIQLSDVQVSGVNLFGGALFIGCVYLSRRPDRFEAMDVLPAAAFTFLPALDFVSDVLYLLQTTFYNYYLFILCVIFVFLANLVFIHKLWEMQALVPHVMFPIPDFLRYNRMLFLSYRDGYPLYHGAKMRSLSFEVHDTLLKVISYIVLWVACIALQIVGVLAHVGLWIPIFLVHLICSILWFLFGLYLFQIKMFAVGRVWTLWFRVWRKGDNGKHDSKTLIDTFIMNESFLWHFLTETSPQLALQSYNNQMCGTFQGIALFSTCLSIFMVVNGLYRYGYYVLYKGVKFGEVPLEIAIGTTIIRLNPASHKDGSSSGLEQGKEGKEGKVLTPADLQIMHLQQDARFNELLMLLNAVETYRSTFAFRPEFTHLFGVNAKLPRSTLWPEQAAAEEEAKRAKKSRLSLFFPGQSEDDKEKKKEKDKGGSNDVSIDVDSAGESDASSSSESAGGAAAGGGHSSPHKKSMRLSLFGPKSTFTPEMLMEDEDAAEAKKDWLDVLDCVAAEFEIDDMPILSDLMVHQIMHAFSDNLIVDEDSLRALLERLATRKARRDYIRDALLFRSIVYELLIMRYFDLMDKRVQAGPEGPAEADMAPAASPESRRLRFANYLGGSGGGSGGSGGDSDDSGQSQGRFRFNLGRRQLQQAPRRLRMRAEESGDDESGSGSGSDSSDDEAFYRPRQRLPRPPLPMLPPPPPDASSSSQGFLEKLGLSGSMAWATGQALTIEDDPEKKLFVPPPPPPPSSQRSSSSSSSRRGGPRAGRDIFVLGPPSSKEGAADEGGGGLEAGAKGTKGGKQKSRKSGPRTRGKPSGLGGEPAADAASASASPALDDTQEDGESAAESEPGSGRAHEEGTEVQGALPIASISSSSVLEPTEVQGLEAIKAWLTNKCGLTPRSAQKYSTLLFLDKGCATVEALSQRVARNPSFLAQAGIEEDDAKQISAALSTMDEAQEALRAWLARCDLTAVKAAHYAQLLYVDKGCASVKALGKRLERNPRYLVDVAGLDADDSDEIVKALQGKKGASSWGWR